MSLLDGLTGDVAAMIDAARRLQLRRCRRPRSHRAGAARAGPGAVRRSGGHGPKLSTCMARRLLENGDFAGLFFTDCRHSV